MKAWRLEITTDPDQGNLIVFANTRDEARSKTGDLMYDRWVDISATRFKQLDDMEHLSQRDLDFILWKEHGWRWYELDSPYEDEVSDEEFREWYDKAFGIA